MKKKMMMKCRKCNGCFLQEGTFALGGRGNLV